jgi:hypothetical protein
MAWSPPTTFVEEVIPEEPIQLPPESMLFTVPENWQPPTSFPEEETQAITMAHHSTGTMDSRMEEFPIFYVEEELPEECLQMAAQDDTILAGSLLSKPQSKKATPGAQGREQRMEQRSGAWNGPPGWSKGGNVGCNKRGSGGWHVEGGWRGPCATSYYDNTGSVACPSALLPPGTTRLGVRFEMPDGRPGLPWHTHEPTHRHALRGFLQCANKAKMSDVCETLCPASSEWNCTMKTSTMKTSTGNCLARIAFWLWLDAQALVRSSVSSNSFLFSLFSVSVVMDNAQTIGRHLSWFPPGRADGGLPLLDMVIQGCQLFWFPLFWRNSWQPKDKCFFLFMI